MTTTENSLFSDSVLPPVRCPDCLKQSTRLVLMKGKNEEYFAGINCLNCGEQGFFQIAGTDLQTLESGSISFINPTETGESLQHEWSDWHAWKLRHLYPRRSRKRGISRWGGVVILSMIIVAAAFFWFDRMHLLVAFFEDPVVRQRDVDSYVSRLANIHCLPKSIQSVLKKVPVRYTRERPAHRDFIQFGETGIYWGETSIKIHRSNLWFFGWPRQSQLVETIIHEARHRASPGLGHNRLFHKLVLRDTCCALSAW